MSKVHIGKKIKEIVDKSGYSVIDFAGLINLTRDGVYKIFNKEFIDTDQLYNISRILEHDFFKYFSQELPVVTEPKNQFGYVTRDEMAEVKHEILELRKLFIEVIENLPQKKAVAVKKYKISRAKRK